YEERVKGAYGESKTWEQLCERAATEPQGGFVVQEVVDTQPEEHLVCGTNQVLPTSFFVDYSAYASVGLAKQPAWGGVCRGSMSEIVNIVGGGGVLPLITTEVASKLLLAWKAL
ncbi:MAG: hypothetical protein EOO72_10585, partial [Myxococcaceae bacterium]